MFVNFAGDYTIHVKYSDHEVSGSPFIAKAYNTGAIIVSPLHDGFVNQPIYFNSKLLLLLLCSLPVFFCFLSFIPQ